MIPPLETLYTSPLVGIGINKEWVKHLTGYLSDMRWRWFGDNATYEGNNEIERFINLIVLGQPTMFIGQIITGVFETTPPNLLLCDGTTYNQVDYPELYDAIHPNMKEPVLNTFRVPDLRARMPIGEGYDNHAYDIGNIGGERQVTLTVSQMPNHRHAGVGGAPYLTLLGASAGLVSPGSGVKAESYTAYEGGSQPHNNMPPYFVVQYYIVATL